MEGSEHEEQGRRFVCNSAAVLYIAMSIVALIWSWMRTGCLVPDSVIGGRPGESLGLGIVLALCVLIVTGFLMRRRSVMHWFALEVRKILGPVDWRMALILGLLSGLAEELLFRGVMQSAFGYVVTSFLFGLLHVGPDRRYFVWTVFAVVMGFLLGGILLLTGSLLGPVVAHVLVNTVNLRRIGRFELPDPEPTSLESPPTV